jgi:DNA polymerase II small subunit
MPVVSSILRQVGKEGMNEILKMCAGKGFFLDKAMLDFLTDLDLEKVERFIEILSGLKSKEGIITYDFFKENIDRFHELFGEQSGENKRGVRLLSVSKFPLKKFEAIDFVQHFKVRFERTKEILEAKGDDGLISIRRIGSNSGVCNVIAAVLSKKITKNKNLLIEVEDLTGSSLVLVNHENVELFERAKNLLLDDIVMFRVSGSGEMLFANDIIYPDICLDEEKYGEEDEYVAFSGDMHVGSKMFLENNFLKFVAWINGEVGDVRQRAIALKVKYLFLTGNSVDGVGEYPGQENFLNIKSCVGQYEKVAELLSKIREDVEIIVCPGQRDAVWLGEPQPSVPKKWAPFLYNMKNLSLVPSPALVEIKGFKILMYCGASIKYFINEMPGIKVENATEILKEILKRRHLAPVYGMMDCVPHRDDDFMAIEDVPDIVAVGGQHRAGVGNYNNILMVSSSCWQSITPFEEKIGNIPEPCKVPLFNLKTREIKVIDFSDDEIKWDEGDDLVCKLEGKDE